MRLAIGLFLLTCVTVVAPAQSNDYLDSVLAEQQLSYGSAAYLVLASAGEIADEATPTEAIAYLDEQGWALSGLGASDAVNLGEYAHLVMQIYDLSGGLMYRVAAGPRYATRELSHRGILQGRAYPGMNLSAERGVRILGRVLQLDERGLL